MENKQEKLSFLNLLILLLSIYVLGALCIDTFFKIPKEISKILNYIDNIICLVFLYDFVINFKNAENKF